MLLQTQSPPTTTSDDLGTAYAIKFPFKNNYVYAISVTCKGTDGCLSNTYYPSFVFSVFNSLPDPNTTHPSACGAVGKGSWNGLLQSTIGNSTVDSNSKTYDLQSFTVPIATTAPQYLIITTYGGSVCPNKLLISKIIINETDAIKFNTTSNPTSITCGFTDPVTFTATGSNVPASATVSYTWNLGSNNRLAV